MRFLAEHKQAKVGEAIGESELMHLEMHARMGTATCDFFIVLESDPELRKMSTVGYPHTSQRHTQNIHQIIKG